MIKHFNTPNRLRDLVVVLMVSVATTATPILAGEDGPGTPAVSSLAPEAQFDAHDYAALANADPVDRQLATYARQAPEMGFLRLYGAGGTTMLQALPLFLGEAPSNVDYEHDASMRDELVQLQMHRIEVMLRQGMPSATLFKVGLASQFEHPYLCVITLDAERFRRKPENVSGLMAPSVNDEGLTTAGAKAMDVEDFLRFTVDHEVFHCLDAYFNGPAIRRTHDTLAQHYQAYLNEAQADAFASLAFNLARKRPDAFLEILAAIRTFSLLDLDLSHFTTDVIRRSRVASPSGNLGSLAQRVMASRTLVSEVAPSVERFALRLASAAKLVARLGGDPHALLNAFTEQPLPHATDTAVASLHRELLNAKRTLAIAAGPGTGSLPAPELPSWEDLPRQSGTVALETFYRRNVQSPVLPGLSNLH